MHACEFCLDVRLCACYPQKLEEDMGSFGPAVIDDVSCCVGLGIKHGPSEKAVSALNHLTSPSPYFLTKILLS